MTFDAAMFLTEAGRFITFNGACKVNLIFNFRLKKKIYHSEIVQRLLSRTIQSNCIVW